MWRSGNSLVIFLFVICFVFLNRVLAARKYDRQDLMLLREEVRQMFEHAYTSYLKYAYPYDELRPLTCDGIDTWGSYSLTLIDALDTLAVMGNYSEFQRVVGIVTANANFDANINVSVFETNIRIVGGLLSAHLLSQRAGVSVEPGWPCNGPLLRLAEDVARRLIVAFATPTGMPYGTVNLRHGVPSGETTVTCTAGVGTFILEFGTLSRLTGDPIYEEVALNALHCLYDHRSPIGLFGNHIDVMTGRWTAQDSGIGAGVDSYFEYLVKGSILLQRPELMVMFNKIRQPIDRFLRKDNWYVWASMNKGQVTLPVFQSLEAYWPGVLTLVGDVDSALRSMHNYNAIWKQYGFTPEFYNIGEGAAGNNRESYPLRPELVESAMYLYRATGDPAMLDIGVNILRSIQHSAKTPCGYATINDVRDHTQENRMESFFLAETTKYLYLLFDPDNFIHNKGNHGRVHTLHSGRQCVLDAGGYIFNTEAHPIDPGALLCCHDPDKFLELDLSSTVFSGTLHRHHGQDYRGERPPEHAMPTFPEEVATMATIRKEAGGVEEVMMQGKSCTMDKKPAGEEIESEMKPQKTIVEEITVQSLAKANNLPYTTIIESTSKGVCKNTLGTILEMVFFKQDSSIGERSSVAGKDERQEVVGADLKAWLSHSRHALNNLLQVVKSRKHLADAVAKLQENIPTSFEGGSVAEQYDKLKEKILDALKISDSVLEMMGNNKTVENEEEVSTGAGDGPMFHQDKRFTTTEDASKEPVIVDESRVWIPDNLSYQTDDDPNHPATSPPQPSIGLPEFVKQLVILSTSPPPPPLKFDPQQLLEKIRSGRNSAKYARLYAVWQERYELLACKAQPFLVRITRGGEFVDDK